MRRILFGTLCMGLLGAALFALPMLLAQQSPFPPLPVLQAIDKNGDGEVSAEELAAAPAALRSLDKNADGKLEGAEIVPDFGFGPPEFAGGPGGFGFGGPGGPGGPAANRALVDKFDKDGDGRLNTEERAAAQANAGTGGGGFGGGRGGGPGGRGGGPGGQREPSKPGIKIAVDEAPKYPDADLYDTSILRTLFITFENEKWEEELAAFNNTDVEVPAKLVVDGKTYPEVGVHFRGMSSYMMVPAGSKRSLNLTMDYSDSDQKLYGYKTLNLLNSNGDPSFLSSVLYSHIARKYIAAPKANFVRVVINGENWGVYVNVQQFNKDFVAENFGTTKGSRWKVSGSPGGDGGLRYFGENIDEYKRRFQIKSGDEEQAWQDLAQLCKLLDQTPAEELEAKLSGILDIDETLWFLALDCSLVNSDGYWTRASDYSIYQDENRKFHVIPHDMNEAFHGAMGGGQGGRGGRGGPGGGGRPRGEGAPPADAPRGGPPAEEGRRPEGGPPGIFEALGFGGPGGPGGPGGGGPGGFGGRGGGPGGMNEGSVELDPLVGLENARMPLRSKLLAVPKLKEKYLQCVRTIAEQSLTWDELGPIITSARQLLDKEVSADTRKLNSYENFLVATNPELPAEGTPRQGLRNYIDLRRAFLLKNSAVAAVSPLTVTKRVPIVAPSIDLKAIPVAPKVSQARVIINELLAGNTKSAKDPQGEFEDFIELFNPTGETMDLSGMYLTDSDKSPRKWRFPSGTTLAAKSYLVVWADENANATPGLHANFKLSRKGESVYLVDNDQRGNAVLDYVTFETQTDDVAFGRLPTKTDKWQPLVPTPGAANRAGE
jgi:spore coat protein CotH